MVASPVVDLMPLVEKYKPTSTQKIIGQQGASSCVNKLSAWLGNWYKNLDTKPIPGRFGSGEGAGFRAALLSGPPGVGKTTSAHLVCKEAGFSFVEFNASDTRNKSSLENEVRSLLANSTLHDFSSGGSGLTTRHVLIMDEVDGMAGNEDRGGIAELIQLIKKTQIPIICICNDRNHQKVRNLANYCFDLRFYRPRVEQIKGAMMSVCYKEGIKIGNDELTKLIVSSNQDVRQVLHHLSLLCTKSKGKSAPMEQHGTIKDVRFNLFDALVKLFTYDENKPLSFSDRSDLFFTDYSMIPLFVYENYPNAHPLDVSRSKANTKKRLELGAKAMASIAFGNLIENEIRSTNNWSLLPLQAAFAAVLPSYYLGGSPGGRPEFPKFLGKQSTIGKNDRLLKELKMHMSLRVNNGKSDLNMDYVPALLNKIYKPLKKRGTDAVSQVLETMNYYSLRKEDLDTMLEFIWSNQKNPASELDSKIKSALTRACNSKGEMLPYTTIVGKKSKKRTIAEMSGTDDEEEEEEEEEILIKPKKVIKKEASSKADDESTAKSKAKQTKGTKRSRSPSKTRGGGTRGRGRKK